MTTPDADFVSEGPSMQPPVSGTLPLELAKKLGLDAGAEDPQAQPGGQPEETESQGEETGDSTEAQPFPVIPGLDETDISLLSEEERAKLGPIFKKIARAMGQQLEQSAEQTQKAAAWDAALSVPGVVEALKTHLGGEDGAANESANAPQEIVDDLGDLDATKLQAAIAKTVENALSRHVAPLKQDIESLRGHVAKTVLDSQFAALDGALPGLSGYREEVMDLLAKGEASSIETAYDLVRGRLLRQGKLKPEAPKPATPPSSQADRARGTIVSELVGPAPSRVNRYPTKGMTDHLKAAMAELGVDGID